MTNFTKKLFTTIQLVAVVAMYSLPGSYVANAQSATLAKANDDTFTVKAGESLTADFMANDEPSGLIYFDGITSYGDASIGTLSSVPSKDSRSGQFTFDSYQAGTYTFTYSIYCNTAEGRSYDTATVTITVTDDGDGSEGPNQCLATLDANNDTYVIKVGQTVTKDVTANDNLSNNGFFATGTPSGNSSVSFSDNVGPSYTFTGLSEGTYTFEYTVGCPDSTSTQQATVSIVVEKDEVVTPGSCSISLTATPSKLSPNQQFALEWNTTGNVTSGARVRIGSQNDTRPEFNLGNRPLNDYLSGSAPSQNGVYNYRAAVKCADGSVATSDAVISVTSSTGGSCLINANNDQYSTTDGVMRTYDVLANDTTSANGNPLTIDGIVSGPSNGKAVVVGNKIQYTANSSFKGTDTLVYRAENDCGQFDTATVTFNVNRNNGGGGGGGGGILPPRDRDKPETRGDSEVDLDIFNERLTKLSDSKYVITWNTNIPATSQVVYGMRSVSDPDGTCGKSDLGYQQRTDVKTNRVTTHVMIVDGLTPGAQYFFRPVSDRSDADCAKGRELTYRPANICEGYIKDFMKIGQYNDPREVAKLQAFLRIYEGSNVRLTGVFDAATDKAVKDFQLKYYEEVLQPWGYERDEATGYVYITTRNKINEIICNRDIPFTAAQLSEIASFRNFWKNRFNTTTVVATQPYTPNHEKAAGVEALLPAADSTDEPEEAPAIVLGGNTDDSVSSISDEEFFLDTVTDEEVTETSAEAELAQKSVAGAAAAGIISFVFSLPFLLTVLAILILMLIYEVIKDRKTKKTDDEIVIVETEGPSVPTRS